MRAFFHAVSLLLLFCIFTTYAAEKNEFEDNINFIVYNYDNEVFNWTINSLDFEAANCSTEAPLSFIVPGWKDHCNTSEWIPDLVDNLKKYRGGCIVCMDYNYYSKNPDYFGLLMDFDEIYEVLLKGYQAFQNYGHEPKDVFFFGFSFGAQLTLDVGREVNRLSNGTRLISRIDVCEPTGVGFLNMRDWKVAADNVQCIHTNSISYGTMSRNCHQDWNLGMCGNYQLAHGPYPKGSHGLCPYFYNSAFENDFYAIQKEETCSAKKEAKEWPNGFKMGYNEKRFNVTGEFYATTTKDYPYNKDVAENDIKS